MVEPMIIAAFFLVTVASLVACHLIARGRGGNAVFWGVMGAVFGPFAIPFAFRAKPKSPSTARRER
jgi:hypothetical protein